MSPAWILKELTYEMDRYRWNFLELCELRCKNVGETTTVEGHKLYYNGEENNYEYGVGFLVHKDITTSVLGCRSISSRHISTRLRSDSFNITVIQAYAPTAEYSDDKIDYFWLCTTTGVHQGCLLLLTLFNIFWRES